MCLFKVYTGYTREVAEYLLITAETWQIAEGIALNKLWKDGATYKLPLEVELVFEDLSIQNVAELEY